MKKQNVLFQRITVVLIFFGTVLTTVSCKHATIQEYLQGASTSPTKPNRTKANIHAAIINHDKEAIKRDTEASFRLSQKDPLAGLTQLPSYFVTLGLSR